MPDEPARPVPPSEVSLPFGAASVVETWYDETGRFSDEADADQWTHTYLDADGGWVGCAEGYTDAGLARLARRLPPRD